MVLTLSIPFFILFIHPKFKIMRTKYLLIGSMLFFVACNNGDNKGADKKIQQQKKKHLYL